MRDSEALNASRNWKYSYSGADCRAYAYPKGGNAILLDSMATASISVHEAKAPVRQLGKRAVVGFTESIRTIAGSIIFTIVQDHPLKSLIRDGGNITTYYSSDLLTKGFKGGKGSKINMLPTLLEDISLYFVYKTEVQSKKESATLRVKGVRFINQGIVTSVNDMVTEMVLQFVAEDVEDFFLDGEIDQWQVDVVKPPAPTVTPKTPPPPPLPTPAPIPDKDMSPSEANGAYKPFKPLGNNGTGFKNIDEARNYANALK